MDLFKLENIDFRKLLIGVGLGQILSFCITATGVTSQMLSSNYGLDAPTTQSSFNYFLLSFYLIYYLIKIGVCSTNKPKIQSEQQQQQQEEDRLVSPTASIHWRETVSELSKRRLFIYLMLAFADVEANYLFVKAYQYTSITSVMLLDCATIPFVMVFSRIFLKRNYGVRHFGGVALCLIGVSFLVISDYLYSPERLESKEPVFGDLLCIFGSFFYAISNVGEEIMVSKHSRIEWISFIGIFGTLISALQLFLFEKDELESLQWNYQIVLLMMGFFLSLFLLYSLSPFMMVISNAVLFNLSILTADIYSLIIAVFLFQQQVIMI